MTDRVASVRVFRAVVVIASLLLFILLSSRPHDIGIAQSTGLVAAYGFNEATGTAVTDASGNANNGTISGATRTATGRYGGALSFDGVNDIVTIPDSASLDLTTGMTIEAWVSLTSASGWRTVILKEIPGELSYALYANDSANRSSGWLRIGSSSVSASSTAAAGANTWTHLAVTYDGANLRVYRNATLQGTRATTGSLVTSSSALRIGGNTIWGEYLAGAIDEVRVYNRALSQAEIQTDMNTAIAAAPTDSTPPSASITAPAAGATVGGTTTVSASASDNVGVAGVQFLLDGANLGTEDTTAPYSVSWSTAAASNGPHQLSARARDAAGNATTSAAITVTVQNIDGTAPTVSLTAPANGASVSGTVTVSASASDNVGVAGVQFLLDGAALGTEDTSAPYSVAWASIGASDGSHTLAAAARDAAGNITTSVARTVTVQNTDGVAPMVSLSAPAANATVAGTVTVSATASDNVGVAGVQFVLDGATLGSEDTSSPYSVSWATTGVSDGEHTLSAVARDAAGNLTQSASRTVQVSNGAPPQGAGLVAAYSFNWGTGTALTDASPSGNHGTISGATWTTAGRNAGALQFDGTNDMVTIADSASLDLTSGVTIEAWVYPTSVSGTRTAVLKEISGNLAYALYANDSANRGRGSVRINSVTRSSASTATLPLNTWTHIAMTYDGSTLRFFRNGSQNSSLAVTGLITTSSSPLRLGGSQVFGQYFAGRLDDVRIYNRALSATEIQTDQATAVPGDAAPPDSTSPTVTISSPTSGTVVSGSRTVSATAADNVGVAGVQFYVDGNPIGSEDTSSPFSVSWSTTSIGNGSHALTARARDAAGNTTLSSSVSVTVSNTSGGGGGGSSLSINGATRYQTMDGFGVSANSASWNDGELIPALDLLLDVQGSSLWRVIIDNASWESTNDNADPQVFNWDVYNAIYTTPKWEELWATMAYLNQKGITDRLMLNFMGPGPSWMGGSDLNASAVDEWVEMVASAAYYARFARGLQFGMFAPNNESDHDGIEGIRMSATLWTTAMTRLVAKLETIGLGDLRIVGPDTAFIQNGVGAYMTAMMDSPALMAKLDHFAFHNYSGQTGGAASAIASSDYPNKNFWMTEYSRTEDLWSSIPQGPTAMLMWDAYDSVYNHAILAGRGTAPPNDAGNAPAFLSYAGGVYTPRKSFYEAAQVFKFVPPGSVRISANESTAAVVFAFHHPGTGRVTIVGRNTGSSSIGFSGVLSNLPAVPAFEFYYTTSTVNLQRGSDVPVNGTTFSVTVPAGATFTLSYAGASPPAGGNEQLRKP